MCIALERVRFVAALTPKRLLMPSFVGPGGKRCRLDPGTVLACVYDAQDGDGAVSKIVDVAHKTVGKCQKTFLDLYAWKVKQLFQKQNRIAIVCDGTPFNGDEFEIFLVYCADIDIFASMQPQVCMIRKGVSIGYTAPPVSAQFCTKSVPVTENRAQSRTFSHVPALPRTFSHTSARRAPNDHRGCTTSVMIAPIILFSGVMSFLATEREFTDACLNRWSSSLTVLALAAANKAG